jgi:hypothetical protein
VGLGDPDGERGGESAFSYLARACRLAALPKPDGSPRPIAVGDAFYRIAARCLLKLIGPERINNALLPGQFGVGSKGGVEPLVHALRGLLTEFKILTLDFVNAFNEVERVIDEVRATFPVLSPFVTWVYGTPSDLLVTMDTFEVERVLSQRGVRQGCPFSPLLFSLVMRVILRQLAERMAPRIVGGLGLAPPSQQGHRLTSRSGPSFRSHSPNSVRRRTSTTCSNCAAQRRTATSRGRSAPSWHRRSACG